MRRLVSAVVLVAGCAATSHVPRAVARHELVLRYPRHLAIDAGHALLTEAPDFTGLAAFVHCVDAARRHAQEAERFGARSTFQSRIALGLAVASAGGYAAALGGAADGWFEGAWGAVPLALGALGSAAGLVVVLLSRWDNERAHGHAVDAVNYYNDEVGSWGARCPPQDQTAKPTPRNRPSRPSSANVEP
jgi:hypothetical protein